MLSGGGMFGAWQAGAWQALASQFQPDLVVGASAGALNGYAIASGAPPEELANFWLRPEIGSLGNLPQIVRALMDRYSLKIEYAAVVTDLLRMKPKIFAGPEVTWRHLAASCAIPGVLRQYRIDGRWCSDGGLLNPLPAWAAADLGATRIVAIHVLPQIPSMWLKPAILAFRGIAGHHPRLPERIEMVTIKPGQPLGSMRDALHWRRENAERWIEAGYAAARNISLPDCIRG